LRTVKAFGFSRLGVPVISCPPQRIRARATTWRCRASNWRILGDPLAVSLIVWSRIPAEFYKPRKLPMFTRGKESKTLVQRTTPKIWSTSTYVAKPHGSEPLRSNCWPESIWKSTFFGSEKDC
jgi:hypothetical protein